MFGSYIEDYDELEVDFCKIDISMDKFARERIGNNITLDKRGKIFITYLLSKFSQNVVCIATKCTCASRKKGIPSDYISYGVEFLCNDRSETLIDLGDEIIKRIKEIDICKTSINEKKPKKPKKPKAEKKEGEEGDKKGKKSKKEESEEENEESEEDEEEDEEEEKEDKKPSKSKKDSE